MKRTSRRHSLVLNSGKFEKLVEFIDAYNTQKDAFMLDFAHLKYIGHLKDRAIRDELVKMKFKSDHGLKARAWKQALSDALQTIRMYWEAAFESSRNYIYRKYPKDSDERKLALFLTNLFRAKQVVEGNWFEVPAETRLTHEQCLTVCKYVRRRLRHEIGKRPRVKISCSACLDPDMYRVFRKGETEYISVTTLSKRVVIPLKGHAKIDGNVQLVLNRVHQTVQIHVVGDLENGNAPEIDSHVGIDLGTTELMTDSNGHKWYEQFWGDVHQYAEKTNEVGKARNKLHAIQKSHREDDPAKAARIKKYNLGKIKQKAVNDHWHGRIETEVNTALNQFLAVNKPSRTALESLRFYKPPEGKGRFSRHMSFWTRKTVNSRFPFKMQVGGSSLESVNCAYSSQTCTYCGYVDRKNRSGDRFKCLRCGKMLDADVSASRILVSRLDDPEIHLWTKKEHVRQILEKRYQERSRLEGQKAQADCLTVSGPTPGVAEKSVHVEQPTGERNFGGGIHEFP